MIYKTVKQEKYQCINNDIFILPISEGARCLLAYMLTKPSDWQFYNKAIETEFRINQSKLRKYLKELKDYGLVRKYRVQVTGRFQWITEVYESLDLVPSEQKTIGSNSTDSKTIDSQHTDILSTESNQVLNRLNTDNNNSTNVELAKANTNSQKDITINKKTSITNERGEYGQLLVINELFTYWKQTVGYEISGRKQQNRNACSNLIRKHGVDTTKRLINGVAQCNSDKYAPRISDFTELQSKMSALLAWGNRKIKQSNSGGVAVI